MKKLTKMNTSFNAVEAFKTCGFTCHCSLSTQNNLNNSAQTSASNSIKQNK